MTRIKAETVEHIRQLLYKLPNAVFNGGTTTAFELQKEILDELNMLCTGYFREYFVASTYHEHGRPKGFFVLSVEEGKCDFGFSGNPAFYKTHEQAQTRADRATDKAWEVRSIVRKK